MAMEDSVCLADEMAAHPGDIEAALDAYCRERVPRTGRVVRMSRAVGEHIYHPAGVHAALRNAIIRAKSDNDWYDTLAWLYWWDRANREAGRIHGASDRVERGCSLKQQPKKTTPECSSE